MSRRPRTRSARGISACRWWLGNNLPAALGGRREYFRLLRSFGRIPDAYRCTHYISRRYSDSLPDQPVADRWPRQTNRARGGDHPRGDFIAEVHRGVLSLLAASAPADAGAFHGRSQAYLSVLNQSSTSF